MLYWVLFLAATASAKVGIGLAGPPAFGSSTSDTAPIYLQGNAGPYISREIPIQFPFPGDPSKDKAWKLTLNVSEVVDNSLPGAEQGDTNSVLSFLWPNGSGFESMSSNINACALVITNITSLALFSGQNELGSCAQTLGQDCINNLTSALSSGESYVAGNCAGLSGVVANICPQMFNQSVAFRTS
jgi:hypothetical protein